MFWIKGFRNLLSVLGLGFFDLAMGLVFWPRILGLDFWDLA